MVNMCTFHLMCEFKKSIFGISALSEYEIVHHQNMKRCNAGILCVCVCLCASVAILARSLNHFYHLLSTAYDGRVYNQIWAGEMLKILFLILFHTLCLLIF